MFYSYYIDVQLSHLNKDYLLTYTWTLVNARTHSYIVALSLLLYCCILLRDVTDERLRV